MKASVDREAGDAEARDHSRLRLAVKQFRISAKYRQRNDKPGSVEGVHFSTMLITQHL